jgi:hypothetical protein
VAKWSSWCAYKVIAIAFAGIFYWVSQSKDDFKEANQF